MGLFFHHEGIRAGGKSETRGGLVNDFDDISLAQPALSSGYCCYFCGDIEVIPKGATYFVDRNHFNFEMFRCLLLELVFCRFRNFCTD